MMVACNNEAFKLQLDAFRSAYEDEDTFLQYLDKHWIKKMGGSWGGGRGTIFHSLDLLCMSLSNVVPYLRNVGHGAKGLDLYGRANWDANSRVISQLPQEPRPQSQEH